MQVEYKSQPLRQNWDKELPRYWFDNSPFKTHFLNAVSIVIPASENVVIHTLKETRPLLTDPVLKEQVGEMIAQENWHSFSHRKYNEWLTRIGLPAPELAVWYVGTMQRIKRAVDSKIGPKAWLPLIVCGEHNAVCMMEYFLERPKLFAQMHPHFRQAWLWHFVEELEHKGSSMDMWHDTRHIYNYKRWVLNAAFALYMVRFKITLLLIVVKLLNHDKQLWKLKTLKDAVGFLFGWDGLHVRTFLPLLRFFKPNFHPWDHDTRYLINRYAKLIEGEHMGELQAVQIDSEFKACIADIEEAINANNIKKY